MSQTHYKQKHKLRRRCFLCDCRLVINYPVVQVPHTEHSRVDIGKQLHISLPNEVSLSGFESLNFRRPITVCGSDTSCVISARIVVVIAAISCHPRCVGGGSPRPPCFSQSKNGAPPAVSKPFALFSSVFSRFSVGDAVRAGILVAC